MAEFEQAIEKAKKSEDPPFFPPPDYKHLSAKTENDRIYQWRMEHHHNYPGLDLAFYWLLEMLERVNNNNPPVTAAEFYELGEWFKANLPRMKKPHSGLIEVGEGEFADPYHFLHGIKEGHRAVGVTALIEKLRRVREYYRDLAES